MVELARGLGEARIHAGDGPPIGLVAPGGGGIVRGVGERRQLRAHRGEIGGERQFAAELVQFDRDNSRARARSAGASPRSARRRSRTDCRRDRRRSTSRRAGTRRSAFRARLVLDGVEPVLDRAVEARQLAEERIVVIGEAVRDLVDHLEPRLAQHVGAPQDEHGAPQLLFVGRELRRVADPLALVEQIGDLEFARQRALAPALPSDGRSAPG